MEHFLCSDVNSPVHRLIQSGPNQLGVMINLCLNTQTDKTYCFVQVF